MLSGRIAQRGVLLNLDCLYSDSRDLKSRVLCDLNRVEFRGVESLRNSFEGANQGSADRHFLRQPEAQSGTGPLEPHEMPASLANHSVKNARRDLFNNGPLIADGLSTGV
jgi:hypothetical protein